MIIDAILEVIIDFIVGVFSLLHIPDTPQFLLDMESFILGMFRNYGMPICNFLFNHSIVSITIVTVITIFNIWWNYKILIWIYDKFRGGKSE